MSLHGSIAVRYVVSHVYVHLTDEAGAEHIRRHVCPHDGATQAVREALANFEDLPDGWRVREAYVFQEEPRRFRVEPVVRRSLEAREW